MTGTTVYVGIGSNLKEPLQQVQQACRALSRLPETVLEARAPGYRSRALGPAGQPDYINTVARLKTTLAPVPLLDLLQEIEQQQGRERSLRWGPRTLDLDILLYGNLERDTDRLTLPHPQLVHRDFVLQPLLDLQPDLQLPDGRRIAELRRDCPDNGLERLD